MFNFYCVTINAGLRDNAVRDELLAAAYIMTRGRTKRYRLKSRVCEGEVTTVWQRQLLGGISGIRFDAKVECKEGSFEIGYIFREQEIPLLEEAEELAWIAAADDEVEIEPRPNPIRRLAGRN